MDPTIAASAPATTGSVHFLNIEYLFYLIYQWTHGASATGSVAGSGQGLFNTTALISALTTLWVVVTILAYLIVVKSRIQFSFDSFSCTLKYVCSQLACTSSKDFSP